jgi:hypothetical protein
VNDDVRPALRQLVAQEGCHCVCHTIVLTPQTSAEAVVNLGAQAQEGTRK